MEYSTVNITNTSSAVDWDGLKPIHVKNWSTNTDIDIPDEWIDSNTGFENRVIKNDVSRIYHSNLTSDYLDKLEYSKWSLGIPDFRTPNTNIDAEKEKVSRFVASRYNTSLLPQKYFSNTDTNPWFFTRLNWASNKGTGWHMDPAITCSLLLRGDKTWSFVEPKHAFHMQPEWGRESLTYNSAYHSYPSPEVTVYKVRVSKGDLVCLPPWWFHLVRNNEYDTSWLAFRIIRPWSSDVFRQSWGWTIVSLVRMMGEPEKIKLAWRLLVESFQKKEL